MIFGPRGDAFLFDFFSILVYHHQTRVVTFLQGWKFIYERPTKGGMFFMATKRSAVQ
jgi:hypothetical protein